MTDEERLKRAAKALGAGWAYNPRWPKPAAQKGYCTVTAYGRGYQADFDNGSLTARATGATPAHAVENMRDEADRALVRAVRHLEDLRK